MHTRNTHAHDCACRGIKALQALRGPIYTARTRTHTTHAHIFVRVGASRSNGRYVDPLTLVEGDSDLSAALLSPGLARPGPEHDRAMWVMPPWCLKPGNLDKKDGPGQGYGVRGPHFALSEPLLHTAGGPYLYAFSVCNPEALIALCWYSWCHPCTGSMLICVLELGRRLSEPSGPTMACAKYARHRPNSSSKTTSTGKASQSTKLPQQRAHLFSSRLQA